MRAHRMRLSTVNARGRRGFVLLTVLIMLAFAVLATSGMARRSLRMALHAQRSENELQRKWLRHGLRQSVLPQAAHLLAQANSDPDAPTHGPLRQLLLRVSLNGSPYTILIADEQAKLNVNTFRELTNATRTRALLRRATLGSDLPLRLTAFSGDHTAQSWGEVFDLSASVSSSQALVQATTDLTCWGSGALNFVGATDDSVRSLVGAGVGSEVAERILELRSRADGVADWSLPDHLALRRRQRERLQQIVTVGSQCHSVWLLPEDALARGEFHVLDRTHRRRGDVLSFVW